MMSNPRPNFFIVGAPKCGTTALHRYLSAHPDVFMSEPKEPRFFDTDFITAPSRRVQSDKEYAALFENTGDYKRIGEASPSYLSSIDAPHNIKAYQPDAKIVIILRQPVDFMFSHHRQWISTHNEDIIDFQEALAAEPARATGKRVPKKSHFPAGLEYRKQADFPTQVERYFSMFGRDNVYVTLLDDYRADPVQAHTKLLEFLGLDTNPSTMPNFEVVNAGASKDLRNFAIRRLLKNNDALRRTIGLLPASVRGLIGQTATSVTGSKVDAKKPIAPELRHKLTAEFEPQINRLATLIDRDLTHWLNHKS